MSCLLDTNIILRILKGDDNLQAELDQAIFEGREIFVSIITYYELRRGYVYVGRTPRHFEEFIAGCKLLPFTQSSADIASEIYAKLKKKQKLSGELDILIAANAKEEDIPVVAHDKHFSHIDDIKHEQWKTI